MVLDLGRIFDRQRAILEPLDLLVMLPQMHGWLMSLQQQALAQVELAFWCAGIVEQIDALSLIPPISDPDGSDAAARVAKKVQTLGPRIMKIRREGAIGTVDWQGEVSESYEAAFPEGKVAELARELFDQGLQTGIMAAMAYREDETQRVRVSKVGGFLRLLYNLEDMSRVLGMYQAWQHWDYRRRSTWTVRIYDFRNTRMIEWRNLTAPYQIAAQPALTMEQAPMPRYTIVQKAPDGQPLGELMQEWPILRKELAQQMQIARMEESTAFPFLIFSGQTDTAQRERGPTRVFHFPQGGDAKYVAPGNLDQLRDEHERTLTRIQHDLMLVGGFGGGVGRPSILSGEALREANVKFYNASRDYADAITGLGNDVLLDFAALASVPEAKITVAPNRETFALETIDRVIQLYINGIIPLTVAAREVQPILSTFSDEDLEEWIAAQTGTAKGVTPELVRLLLGGGPAAPRLPAAPSAPPPTEPPAAPPPRGA